MIAYRYDDQDIYTESVEFDPKGAIPHMSLLVPPPELTGTQVARRLGNDWEVLPERPTPPEPTPEEIAAREQAEAQAQAAPILAAYAQKQAAQAIPEGAATPAQFALFAKAGLFDAWAPDTNYTANQRIAHEGVVYEVIQPVLSQAHQAPGGAGMLAVYRPLSVDAQTGAEPDGSLENPYAFIYGMDVRAGKYYTFEGLAYLAKSNMIPCVWNPGTPGLWQWERV